MGHKEVWRTTNDNLLFEFECTRNNYVVYFSEEGNKDGMPAAEHEGWGLDDGNSTAT